MKRIVTIQDISCVGKCSLTVALPIISAMGVETAVIPTAVLSTHTMFSGYTFRDLTEEIEPISKHWKSEKIGFDAIYTGYLGSQEQVALIGRFFDDYKTEENLIFVDPVMGDNGHLYTAFNNGFAAEMAKLCGKADIILPNITEACFMTGMDYKESYDEEYIKALLQGLVKLGTKQAVVLTGVSLEGNKTGVVGFDVKSQNYFQYFHRKLIFSYHGTGDIFASATVGAKMNGKSLPESLKIAADYTALAIEETMKSGKEKCYGVEFEAVIPELLKMINK